MSNPLLNQPREVPHHTMVVPAALRVQVYALTLPLGAFSDNEKIWRQLDEDALDSQTSVLLAQNGIRAAVGPQERWPAIAKMLEGPGTLSQEYLCQTDGRSNVQIPTRPNVTEQTVFYVDRDLQLQGRTFQRCDNAIRLSMSPVRGSPDMIVQIEPVVLVGTIEVSRGPQEMGVVRMTLPQEETFRNLRLETQLKSGQFMVLAPADSKASSFSVGTRFLTNTDRVPAQEMVLVFVPVTRK